MNAIDVTDFKAVLERVCVQARLEKVRITEHAHQEMVEESITLDEILEAVDTGHILENYPKHRRGACCLLNGLTDAGRPLHIVCTTARAVIIIITVYEPKPPKWQTPTQRRSRL